MDLQERLAALVSASNNHPAAVDLAERLAHSNLASPDEEAEIVALESRFTPAQPETPTF